MHTWGQIIMGSVEHESKKKNAAMLEKLLPCSSCFFWAECWHVAAAVGCSFVQSLA